MESDAAEALRRPAAHRGDDELGKRTRIERLFARILVYFRLQRPPMCGWSAVETCVALTYAAAWAIALAAWQHRDPSW